MVFPNSHRRSPVRWTAAARAKSNAADPRTLQPIVATSNKNLVAKISKFYRSIRFWGNELGCQIAFLRYDGRQN